MKKIKQRTHHYFSKVTLIYVILICLITMITLSVCYTLLERQKRTDALESYETTLSSLSSAFGSRLNSLSNTFSPLFADYDDYEALCSFFLHPISPYPTGSTDSAMKILSSLCQSNPSCQGVLLLTRSGRLFQYNPIYGSLSAQRLSQTTFRFTPFKRQLISSTQLSALCPENNDLASNIYGISGTVFQHGNDSVNPLGYLILLYSTDEYAGLIETASLDASAVFIISDVNLNILFASNGNLEEAANQAELLRTTMDGPRLITYQGTRCFASSIYSDPYGYLFTYIVPREVAGSFFAQGVLLAVGVFVCLCSILLYFISVRSSSRKIRSIQEGMTKIGQNNLDYRLEVPAGSDEFTQIIQNLNLMCDELQQNVEKAYMYELSQQKAELYAMQTSINPHFLYNSLEQIRVLALSGRTQDAASSLLLLSRMYRTLTKRDLYVTIAEEFSFTENLMQLYSYHYNNFEYMIDVENSVRKYGIPKNTLQPLLENYFVHGLITDSDDNLFTIRCHSYTESERTMLRFEISDNGRSISEEKLAELQDKLKQPVWEHNGENGFALPNVNARLTIVFGPQSALQPSIGPDGGFQITFCIPAILPQDLMTEHSMS